MTVSDTGRNWSDQEIRALIQVWSEEGMCKQLENSTRKRDIFVQISNRLMLQGVERDWKQCHTKYKNLKYLYRSLQKGKAEGADPRRLMRFYDEVDALLTRGVSDSPCAMGYAEPYAEPDALSRLTAGEEEEEEEQHGGAAGASPTKPPAAAKSSPALEEDGAGNPHGFRSTSWEGVQSVHEAEAKPQVVQELHSGGPQPHRAAPRECGSHLSSRVSDQRQDAFWDEKRQKRR